MNDNSDYNPRMTLSLGAMVTVRGDYSRKCEKHDSLASLCSVLDTAVEVKDVAREEKVGFAGVDPGRTEIGHRGRRQTAEFSMQTKQLAKTLIRLYELQRIMLHSGLSREAIWCWLA